MPRDRHRRLRTCQHRRSTDPNPTPTRHRNAAQKPNRRRTNNRSQTSHNCSHRGSHRHTHRHDIKERSGRNPLLTTSHGRPHAQTITSRRVRRNTTVRRRARVSARPRPGRVRCRARQANRVRLPVISRAARRGATTKWLQSDIPIAPISMRADSDPGVIDQYYDRRSDREKAEQRREFIGQV